ncbi:efflux RND transporter periplasmic adaptor subunit [Acidimangrovimonas pyrenivorans]|uniref:Efflux RND transporter periplasmic adaptor subunit n=1 Tax=Acidimangrovimonas pyrenivorans TaxID=2030798 RepID=A0ABV7AIK9_9RHOB
MAARPEEITKTLQGGGHGRRVLHWGLWLVVVALLLAGGGYWWAQRSASAEVSYVTEPATRGPLTVTVTATGTVQPTNQVTISSELSGTLAEVDVDFNDQVTKGQVLARLDTTKLQAIVASSEASVASATAAVAQAEASLTEAKENYDTALELDRRGVTTHTNLITVTAAYDRAKASVAIARANLQLASAALAQQKADLQKAVIRSPINGIVLDRQADAGQIVASSLSAPTLFTIAEDLRHMELQVDVDEADIGQVAVGQEASFTVDAYPGRRFAARITQVRYAPETTDGVVTYKAVLSVDNADLLLRPGMTATATIVVKKLDDALTVPNAALRYAPPQVVEDEGGNGSGLLGLLMPHRRGGETVAGTAGRAVYVLRDGAPVEVPVTSGDSDGKRTAVTSDALKAGDKVIVDQSGGR